MLDNKFSATEDRGKTLDCLERLQDKCEFNCLGVARFLKIEELALSTVISETNSMVDMENVNTLKLRKET